MRTPVSAEYLYRVLRHAHKVSGSWEGDTDQGDYSSWWCGTSEPSDAYRCQADDALFLAQAVEEKLAREATR